MKDRLLALRPLILRVLGYPVFFLFFLLVFLYVTFPYDRLKEAIIAAVESPQTPGGGHVSSNMQLAIDSLGPTFIPGLHAKGVTVTFLPTRAGERATTMRMEDVTVHVGLLSLLFNNLNADVDVEGLGGTVEAHVESALSGRAAGLRQLKLKMDNVRVGELGPLVSLIGLPLGGSMDANVELDVPEGNIRQATGTATFNIDDFRVGDGRAQYQIPRFGGVTVEQIRAGRMEGSIRIREGTATIERLGSRSNEFQLAADGTIALQPDLARSTANVGIRFQLTDAYRRKSEQSGRIMLVMDTVPDIRAARRPDGMIAFRCRGAIGRGVNCPPEGASGRPAGSAGAF